MGVDPFDHQPNAQLRFQPRRTIEPPAIAHAPQETGAELIGPIRRQCNMP